MRIAFALYPRFTALDLIGPYNILAYGPNVTTHLVAATMEAVPADVGTLRIPPDATFDDAEQPDVIVVPGGPGWRRIADDEALTSWLKRAAPSAQWVTSVCTGAFALAGAGLLEGRRATTHWAAHQHLANYGAVPTKERVVTDGHVVTGAGVSAGIDMALTLAANLWDEDTAKAIQLANEYDPRPPYDCGSPDNAPAHVVEMMRVLLG